MDKLLKLAKILGEMCLSLYPMFNVGNSFLFFGEIPAPSKEQ